MVTRNSEELKQQWITSISKCTEVLVGQGCVDELTVLKGM